MGELINLTEYKFKKLNETLEEAKKAVTGGGVKYWDGEKFQEFNFVLKDKGKELWEK